MNKTKGCLIANFATVPSAFYYGDPLGEMRLVSRVFEM
uniref:Uncharacterized protein n=1 Tax=Klebsiella pneumoniae TaxID=573 RepID=A0A6B7PZI4_KLEPN|nr:hypothetical protein [Klebsiella pneumoniae]